VSASIPAERCDWVDVSAADPGGSSSHEVPDCDSAIVAADSQ
jgi:hypothetical protein